MAFVSDSGGPGNLPNSKLWDISNATLNAHILRFSQTFGNGLVREITTPTFASPSSLARRCASLAPMRVTWIAWPRCASTSALSATTEAITSALSTSTTSGASPCSQAR